MPPRHDIAVIGGGIVGCSAALELRRRGLDVVLLERGKAGAGASGVNFGGVRRQGRHPVELPLSMYAHTLWPKLEKDLDTDIEYVRSGHIKLARSERDIDDLTAYAAMAAEYGLDLEMISRRELAARYDWLGPKVLAASLSPGDGYANPRRVTPAIQRACRLAGVRLLEDTKVLEIQALPSGVLIDTGAAELEAAMAVNAAGPGGPALAQALGETVPSELMLPNMLVTEPIRHVIGPAIGVCGGDIYLRQIDRGNVIFGGGDARYDPDTGLATPDAAASAAVIEKAIDIAPALAGATIIRMWAGVESMMPDHLPVLGPSAAASNVLHAFGFSGHGFQIGPAVGEVLADLATRGRCSFDLAPFSIERFAKHDNPMKGTA